MQYFLKKIIWVCLLAVPFLALYVSDGKALDLINLGTSGLYFPFISGKNFIFRLLIEIAFASWIILALHDVKYRLSLNWKKSPLLIAYAVFIGVLFVADLLGVDPYKSFWSNFERMEGFVGHLHFFMYFVVLSGMVQTLTEWKNLFRVYVVSNVLILLWAFAQYLGFKGKTFPWLEKTLEGEVQFVWAKFADYFPIHMSENRLDATIGNSAYFAVYCLFFVFIGALMWAKSKGGWEKWVYPVLMVGNMLGIFYSGTRGTMIGLLVGSLLTLGLLVFRWADSKREVFVLGVSSALYALYIAAGLFLNNALLSSFAVISYLFAGILLAVSISSLFRIKDTLRKVGAGVFITIIAAVLLFQGVKDTEYVQSSPVLTRLASISPTDLTGMSRLSIWKVSYDAWLERPLLGYGQENFSYIYARNFVPSQMWNLEAWYDRSHNVFFDWLIAAGVLGLLSYLSLFAIPLYLMWKKENDMPILEKSIITGALGGYFIHNIFVFDNLTSYILFITLLAYIVMATRNGGGASEKKTELNPALIEPAVYLGLLVAIYFFIYQPYRVNQLLILGLDVSRATQTMSFADVVKQQKLVFTEAIEMKTLGSVEAEEQFMQTVPSMLRVNLPDTLPAPERNAITQAQNELVLAARERASRGFVDDITDVRMLSVYGAFFLSTGDFASAEKVLSRAHAIAPKKQLTTFDYIKASIGLGKYEQAYTLAETSYKDSPLYPEAAKWYLIAAVYAKKYEIARAEIKASGIVPPVDGDIISTLLSQGRMTDAIALLNELKARKPEYKDAVDAYIKELLASQGKK